MHPFTQNPYLVALQWHLEMGVDEGVLDIPNNRASIRTVAAPQVSPPKTPDIQGVSAVREHAVRLAAACTTLDDLRAAIQSFDGLSLKKTATQLVFGDGNPASRVMVIGDAPDGDDDKSGKPFSGPSGLLLDKIMKSIGLDRHNENHAHAFYATNILNWRPPGNRTPSQAELDISLPFIQRHIALVNPAFIIILGGVCAKGLLGASDNISKLRGAFHDCPLDGLSLSSNASFVPSIVTYHPDYLLKTPAQKRLVWADMLMLKQRLSA